MFALRDGVMCYYSEQACRGIVYCNIAFEVGDVGGEAEMLLPLLASAITGLGTSDIPYHLMSHQIGLVFGGLRTDLEVADHAETQNPHAVIWMKSRFLVQYADEALPLLDQLLCQANFADHTRLREIMLEMRNDYRASIVQNGSAYAGLRAEAGLSTLEEKEERLKGISQYQYLDAVLAQPVEKVAAALEKLRDGVIRSCRSEVQLTCDPEHRRSMQDKLPALMVNLWSRDYTDIPSLSVVSDFKLLPLPSVDQPESLVTTTSVNYLAMAFPGALVFQPGFAAQSLISHLLSTGYLWERCRMRGGAYGASAGVHGLSGIFRFITYRDPQTARTLEAFFESFDFMSKQMPSDDLIETGIIALVGKELRPMNPGAKGLLAYRRHRFGITDDLRQENRDRLLALGQEDLRAELQLLNSAMQRGVLSMLVSPQALSEYGQAAELQANESQAAAQDSQQPSVEWLLRRAAVNQHVVVSA
ncbi:MAG: hypothetical protein D6B26_00065 [Spirochaetaceae bacterium]|nr:MAG: hypothetical protein D6B26_00065 [Spirochaetaceae bacterium]